MSPTRVFPLAVLMLVGSAMAQPTAMLALPEPAIALSIDGELSLVSLATTQAPDAGPLGLRFRWGPRPSTRGRGEGRGVSRARAWHAWRRHER